MARERFAAYVAHELRTPIALQRALVEVTLADPDADTAALRRMAERVLACCGRQERLIEGLLALAGGHAGLARDEPVDLSTIASRALGEHDPRGLDTVVLLEPARTTGDGDLLERLAGNLVSNAIRHNHAGGRLEVVTASEARRAVLRVANTGLRVPPGELARLFQPFQRFEPDAADGAGLGLAVVQAIADAHGASLTARARAGGGLEIEVSFALRR